MSRMYSQPFTGVAYSAAMDLLEVSPADDIPCRIAGIVISQVHDSGDVGEAEEEFIDIVVKRGNTTSGSGGSAGTPQPMNPTDGAAAYASEVGNTTPASAGTEEILFRDSFNVRAGYTFMFPDNFRPGANQGDTTLVVSLTDAPADAITLIGTVFVEEL